jgi:NAD(P)-dependent dehydrogenase (short-subunit alcohol dehydrogenase family)
MAVHLAAAGFGVIGTYHSNRQAADEVRGDLDAAGVPNAMLALDVNDASSFAEFADRVREVLRRFGSDHLDYLVNNAGIAVNAAYAETTEEQFDEVVRIQFKAPFFLTQALLAVLGDGGRILNVSTGLARFTTPGFSAYAASKGAIEVLTRYQAKELGGRQIRANVLVPGAIATDFGGGAVRDIKAVNEAASAAIALGRVGEPDDIGAAVPAILSDAFRWANGTRIELSGGQSL